MTARHVYDGMRAAAFVGALVCFTLYGPDEVARLQPDDLVFLAGALVMALALSLLRAPAAHFERSALPTPDSDRIGFLFPLLVVVLVREGWLWAAVLAMLTRLVRPPGLRRRPFGDRLLGAGLRFPTGALGVVVVDPLRVALTAVPGALPLLMFTAMATAFALAVDLFWIDPLLAARQNRALATIWRRHLGDGGTILAIVLEMAWAYVAARVTLRDGVFLGLATLIPLVVVAIIVLRLARVNARLHRLTISREAVDAMLRASDPQPQVRSLLESIDPRIVRESVEVAAFGRGGTDRWSRLVRFGPPVPAELERLGGRVLLEVQVTGDDATIESAHDGTVRAFAAHDKEGGLRGALVVFRRHGTVPYVGTREFVRAATELGPLLGEYGAIAATRSAATIDTLTGLSNRRGVARALDDAMVHVRDGGRYAVLLLDVDHFKSINDLLGHQTGDRALAQIGRIIGENIRGVDLAGRFGGEEFLVLLRDATRERALQVAERLRSAIESSGLAHSDGKPVTVSVGVAYARPTDGAHDVVERADRALYRAKNGGRNRVVESPLLAM